MFESACIALDGIEMKSESLSASFSICCPHTDFVRYNLIFFQTTYTAVVPYLSLCPIYCDFGGFFTL